MLSIFAGLVGLAPSLFNIFNKLTDLKIAQVNAQTDVQKAEINEQIEEVHSKQAALTALIGNRITAVAVTILLLAFGLSTAIVFMKLTIWDKVVGSFFGYTRDMFTTDPLDAYFWGVTMAIVGLLTITSRFK